MRARGGSDFRKLGQMHTWAHSGCGQRAQDLYKLKPGRSQHEGQGAGAEHTLNQGAVRMDTHWRGIVTFYNTVAVFISCTPAQAPCSGVVSQQTGLHDLFVLKERGNMTWKKVSKGNEYNPNTVLRIFKE